MGVESRYMDNKKKMDLISKVVCVIAMFVVVFGLPADAMAIDSDKMIINQIEMNNVLEGLTPIAGEYSVFNKDVYSLDYSTKGSFLINVKKPPFYDSLLLVEQDILNEFDITRNEACFVGFYASSTRNVFDGERDYYPLPHCEGPARVDIFEDGFVNTSDVAQCIDDYDSPGEDKLCDLNIDRKVNALDLSLMLPHIGEIVPEAYK